MTGCELDDLVIRRYEDTDWPQAQIIHDLARPIELDGSCDPRAFVPLADDDNDLQQFRGCQKLVACAAGQVVGFVGINADEIGWLYVHPDHSGKGVGRRLLRRGQKTITGDACVHVLAGNVPAINLYKSEGYSVVDQFKSDNNGYSCTVLKLIARRTQIG